MTSDNPERHEGIACPCNTPWGSVLPPPPCPHHPAAPPPLGTLQGLRDILREPRPQQPHVDVVSPHYQDRIDRAAVALREAAEVTAAAEQEIDVLTTERDEAYAELDDRYRWERRIFGCLTVASGFFLGVGVAVGERWQVSVLRLAATSAAVVLWARIRSDERAGRAGR